MVAVPIAQMARETTGADRGKNTVVLGLMAGWFGFTPDSLLAAVQRKLRKRGPTSS